MSDRHRWTLRLIQKFKVYFSSITKVSRASQKKVNGIQKKCIPHSAFDRRGHTQTTRIFAKDIIASPYLRMDLDARIRNVREELELVRRERQNGIAKHKSLKRERAEGFGVLEHRVHRLLKRGNDLRYYIKAMEQVYYGQTEVPAPYVIKIQGRLLETSHHLEVISKFREMSAQQEQRLTNYMRCEISVIEDEKTDIHAAYLEQRTAVQFQLQEMQQEFCRREIPQHMVLQKLRAVVQSLESRRMSALKPPLEEEEEEEDQNSEQHDTTRTKPTEAKPRHQDEMKENEVSRCPPSEEARSPRHYFKETWGKSVSRLFLGRNVQTSGEKNEPKCTVTILAT